MWKSWAAGIGSAIFLLPYSAMTLVSLIIGLCAGLWVEQKRKSPPAVGK
jgi:hypothetical protein